jgi:hypothetical protein
MNVTPGISVAARALHSSCFGAPSPTHAIWGCAAAMSPAASSTAGRSAKGGAKPLLPTSIGDLGEEVRPTDAPRVAGGDASKEPCDRSAVGERDRRLGENAPQLDVVQRLREHVHVAEAHVSARSPRGVRDHRLAGGADVTREARFRELDEPRREQLARCGRRRGHRVTPAATAARRERPAVNAAWGRC